MFAFIAGIGVIAERLFGPGRWLLLWRGRRRTGGQASFAAVRGAERQHGQ